VGRKHREEAAEAFGSVERSQMEDLLTPEVVARVLGKSKLTIIRWCRTGVLPAIKVGRAWRVRPEDLDAFIQKLANEQRPDRGE
jgi:excisionase family DNA binding protein